MNKFFQIIIFLIISIIKYHRILNIYEILRIKNNETRFMFLIPKNILKKQADTTNKINN